MVNRIVVLDKGLAKKDMASGACCPSAPTGHATK